MSKTLYISPNSTKVNLGHLKEDLCEWEHKQGEAFTELVTCIAILMDRILKLEERMSKIKDL